MTKSDITNFVNLIDFNDKLKNVFKKVTSTKAKHLLVENELKIYKHLIQSIFVVRVILKMLLLKN